MEVEFVDIDLSTKKEVRYRFNQICMYFVALLRDGTEPQRRSEYAELSYVANALKAKFCGQMGVKFVDVDLSTKEEIRFRFNQICAYFAILVRDKTEPQSVYTELYCIASALKAKFCKD